MGEKVFDEDNYSAPKINLNGDQVVHKNFHSLEKHKKEEKKKLSVSYFSLFRYATPIDAVLIIVGLLASIFCGLLQPGVMYLFGAITGSIVDYVIKIHNDTLTDLEVQEIHDAFRTEMLYFCVGLLLIGFAVLISTYIANTLLNCSALRQIFHMRKLFLEKMLNQDVGWYDVHQTGDFAATLTENLSKIEEAMGEKLAIFVFYKSAFVSGVIISLILGWKLALISLISLPISIVTMGLVTWLSSKFAVKEMEAYGSASYVAEEVLSSIRTVLAFEGQNKESKRYREYLTFARNNNIKRSLFSSMSNGLLWFFVFSCYALSFWYGIGLIIEERDLPESEIVYTATNVIAVFTIVIMASWYFGMGTPYFETFSSATGAAEKIFLILDSEPIINKSKESGIKLEKVEGNLKFKNVYFHYPSREKMQVLQGFNLEIKAGETVALVGSSGCGKSTIIQLIQRFYDPIVGEISLDDNNIKHLNLSWLREHIGVVGQEPVLFATTIAENISYGNKLATQNHIERAAKKANVHEFIINLPKGYNTVIGERGAQLSGGQKQRIAIARALVRNPSILLLDEATSALDATSEAQVQATLDTVCNECTTIIVAHRLSTVRNADRIIVLSAGQTVEEGTHDELIALKGTYFKLTASQQSKSQEKDFEVPTDEKNNIIQEGIRNGRNSSISFDAIDEISNDDEGERQYKGYEVILKLLKINRPEWFIIFIACIASIVNGSMMPAYSLVFGDIIGVLSIQDGAILRERSNIFCLYFLLIGIAAGVATLLQVYCFSIAGERLTKRIRSMMFDSMLKQEMGWFDKKDNAVGALCIRLSEEASKVQGASGQCIGSVFSSLWTYFLSAGLALYFEWKLALVSLAFSPFIFLSIYYEQKIVSDDGQGKQKTLETSGKLAIEAIGNIRTIASLGCEKTFHQLYMQELIPHHKFSIRKTHFRSVILGLARGLMAVSYAFVLYYGVHLIRTTGLEYGIVFKVAETVIVGSWSIGNALAYTPNLQKGFNAGAQVLKLLNRIPKIRNKTDDASIFSRNEAKINSSHVYFSYPIRPTISILNGLNLSVPAGKTIALVGSSGCGKSTIIQLLERFYEPKYGNLAIGDQNIEDIDLRSLRSQVGIVSQEPNLFDRTIAENIEYGANDRIVSIEEVIKAAKIANIHEFIASLPLGYETKLGSKGTQLSGGQKQRVAIARALVRNPKILLLDEATSALDNESEKIVQAALNIARKNRTCITIAHRLSTIQDSDIIYVIAEGKVVEYGSHLELITKKGHYYKFYSSQMNIS